MSKDLVLFSFKLALIVDLYVKLSGVSTMYGLEVVRVVPYKIKRLPGLITAFSDPLILSNVR